MTKRSWEIMGKVWPAIICAQHSEKPSILNLMDKLMDKLHKSIEATEIAITVSGREQTTNSEKQCHGEP